MIHRCTACRRLRCIWAHGRCKNCYVELRRIMRTERYDRSGPITDEGTP